jgi:DNA-binding transcriptional ArsR family regulator
MVEYYPNYDELFYSLADATRRDMLRRLIDTRELTVGELAEKYRLTFAAISKHLKVLEKARLINKRKDGRAQIVSLNPVALKSVEDYIRQYEVLWTERFNTLDEVLKDL